MVIEVDIYERIRHLHEHEGRSQREIARILGISRNTVKKYFEGSQVPWEREGISGRERCVFRRHPDTDFGIIRTAYRNYPDSVSGTSGQLAWRTN